MDNVESKRKRLLFLSTRIFWKMEGGHQYEIYHYLRGLDKVYGYDIFVYTFVEDKKRENNINIPDFVKEVRYAKSIGIIDIFKNGIVHALGGKHSWPIQNMLFYSKKNEKAIRQYVLDIHPDVVYVDMTRLATYIKAFETESCLKVLGYDDLLSERYRRQKAVKSDNENIAGAYSDRIPPKIARLQKIGYIKNMVLSFEAKRMEQFELKIADHFDCGIFVSSIECKKFNQKLGREMAFAVSMGVDYNYQSADVSFKEIPNSLSYVGNMKTAANYETVTFIINEVLPKIKSKFTFYVIGTCPDELKQKYSGKTNIIFTGRVDDLRMSIRATTLFLAPIAFGTGIKTKILEAFAMGMPVITNSVGIEGIEAENGKHCFIADNPTEIASFVDLLLECQEKRKELAVNAQQLAKEKYQWEENWKGFAKAGL